MFQSLASYFYGTTSDTSEITTTTTTSDNQQDPTVDVLAAVPTAANFVAKPLTNNNIVGEDIDSDWLIVDKDGICRMHMHSEFIIFIILIICISSCYY